VNTQDLRILPKVELHRHLDGSIRFETLFALALEHGLSFGVTSEEQLWARAKIAEPLGSLDAVLKGFEITQKALCSYEAVRRVAFENVEDCHNDGVVLAELRFAPAFIAEGKPLELDGIIEAVLEGVADAAERFPVRVGLIGIVARNHDAAVCAAATDALVRARESGRRGASRLVGFDLAAQEAGIAPEPFAPLVERARDAGMGITIHTGEDTTAGHVRRTLALYRPDRIGHGIRAWGDYDLVRELADNEVMLEISPTSNWITGSVPSLEEHPLPQLAQAGVPVSINSDDPHLFDIDLVNEYELCRRLYGFGVEDFLRINRDAARASFLDEESRRWALERLGEG
jgi:adenosine deaminase